MFLDFLIVTVLFVIWNVNLLKSFYFNKNQVHVCIMATGNINFRLLRVMVVLVQETIRVIIYMYHYVYTCTYD